MKTIKFLAKSQDVYETEEPPVPAYRKIPNWYKELPVEIEGSFGYGRSVATVKGCVPFIDAMTTGYMVTAPQDIGIKDKDGVKYSFWNVEREDPVLDTDTAERSSHFFIPEGYDKFIWRLAPYGAVETPENTSILITHPFNRYDLPFVTLSAVVDTDKFKGEMALSILIKKDFEGIIEKGTPVAQIFPFIRQNWDSVISPPYSDVEKKQNRFNLYSKLLRSYQRQYWTKKIYK